MTATAPPKPALCRACGRRTLCQGCGGEATLMRLNAPPRADGDRVLTYEEQRELAAEALVQMRPVRGR
jgi:hypothetical protein